MEGEEKTILAVSSGGGHWIQLRRVLPAFSDHRVIWVTVNPAYKSEVGDDSFYCVRDATAWDKIGLVRMALRMLVILLWERPDIVISTGAAPGYFALRFGKMLGAKTVWIDSIANLEKMSLSGRMVRRYADLWLTQWPHLAGDDGPKWKGGVL